MFKKMYISLLSNVAGIRAKNLSTTGPNNKTLYDTNDLVKKSDYNMQTKCMSTNIADIDKNPDSTDLSTKTNFSTNITEAVN